MAEHAGIFVAKLAICENYTRRGSAALIQPKLASSSSRAVIRPRGSDR